MSFFVENLTPSFVAEITDNVGCRSKKKSLASILNRNPTGPCLAMLKLDNALYIFNYTCTNIY